VPPLIGRARDLCPSGVGLQLSAPIALGTHATATVQLPGFGGETVPVSLDLTIQSCRREGQTWVVGSRITGATEQDSRRVVEYCYVVCPPVALPAPVAVTEQLPVTTSVLGAELASA